MRRVIGILVILLFISLSAYYAFAEDRIVIDDNYCVVSSECTEICATMDNYMRLEGKLPSNLVNTILAGEDRDFRGVCVRVEEHEDTSCPVSRYDYDSCMRALDKCEDAEPEVIVKEVEVLVPKSDCEVNFSETILAESVEECPDMEPVSTYKKECIILLCLFFACIFVITCFLIHNLWQERKIDGLQKIVDIRYGGKGKYGKNRNNKVLEEESK